MELLMLLVTFVIGLIMFLAIMKIFSIAHDINMIKTAVKDFTQYYYKLNEYKQQKESITQGNTGA